MIAQSDSPKAILHWFEDETFYSLCSRQHYFLGHLDTESTLEWLYGKSGRRFCHDLPGNLNSLKPEVAVVWGGALSIIQNHTIVPIFSPFQSKVTMEEVADQISNRGTQSTKFRLGLLTGRFGAYHPLKACSECIAEDRAKLGVAYWHLSHQFPGVTLCPVHSTFLKMSSVNAPRSGRFKWSLPDNDILSLSSTAIASDNAFARLNIAVLELARLGMDINFDPSVVRLVYESALNERRMRCPAMPSAPDDFARYVAPLRSHPNLTGLPATVENAATFIQQISRKPRGHSHPLKHLIFINWLLGDFRNFVKCYEQVNDELLAGLHPRRKEVFKSPNQLNTDQGKANRAFNKKRPKKLKPALRQEIVMGLLRGELKESICEKYEVSICTVNRLIRSEPDLSESLISLQKESRVHSHRQLWLNVRKNEPDICPKNLRRQIPHVYAWLYRNDRIWLIEQTRNMPNGHKGNNSNIDWGARDEELVALVLATMRALSESEILTLNKSALYKILPSLSRAMENRKKYPKTKSLLNTVTVLKGGPALK